MVLILLIVCLILLSFLAIYVIILSAKFKALNCSIDLGIKELQDVLGQVFNLLGGLAEENVANRRMIDTVIELIREAKSSVTHDDKVLIKIVDGEGKEKWVEEDSEF